MDGSKIARFIIKRIVEAKNNSKVFPDYYTQLEYYCDTDTNFTILEDQQSIIGVQYAGLCNLICMENIFDKDLDILTYPRGVRYKGKYKFTKKYDYIKDVKKMPERKQEILSENHDYVRTVLVSEKRDSILAGEDYKGQGRVVEYFLKSGQLKFDYGSLKIGKIRCGRRIGNLAFFGSISGVVRVIDTLKQEILYERIKTSVLHIYSLDFCPIIEKGHRVYFAVAGRFSCYKNNTTDIFNISELMKQKKILDASGKTEETAEIFENYFTEPQINTRFKEELWAKKNQYISLLKKENNNMKDQTKSLQDENEILKVNIFLQFNFIEKT
jgi:hypothetical protein